MRYPSRGDEEGKISAFRDRNNVRLTLPFGLKVGAQSFSQLAGLDADNAVLAHVVVRRAMKNVDRDLLFLDLIQGFTAESTVAYISEKLLELRRFLKTVTRENPLKQGIALVVRHLNVFGMDG
jgi:hypothetical protein